MSHQSPITNGGGPNNFTQSTVPGMPNQVIHVRSDSDNQLEELFKVGLEMDGIGPQVPFRMRKLPESFFNPGLPGPMRQSPADSSGFTNLVNANILNNNNTISPSLPVVSHTRTRSAPTQLQQTSLRPAATPPVQHARQHSYDIAEDNPNTLPDGWEVARTLDGHRYFINHIKQITTWHDPRKTLITQSAISRTQNLPQAPNVSLHHIGPLPQPWEQRVTAEGEIYYLNHVERTTSWFDPRLQQQAPPPQTQQQPQQQQVTAGNMRPQAALPHMNPSTLSPPINSLSLQNQTLAPANVSQQLVQQAEQRRQMQMLQLQIEKENLRKRQEEIHREEMRLRHQQAPPPVGENGAGEGMQITEMASLQNDPFLGQNTDLHTRQESADSGLGGMGTSYTLSRTPDDLLGNVDEIDMQEGGHKVTGGHDFGTQMEINNMSDAGDSSNMDSDELVPSLHEELSSELLHDVESVLNTGDKMDNLLTWL